MALAWTLSLIALPIYSRQDHLRGFYGRKLAQMIKLLICSFRSIWQMLAMLWLTSKLTLVFVIPVLAFLQQNEIMLGIAWKTRTISAKEHQLNRLFCRWVEVWVWCSSWRFWRLRLLALYIRISKPLIQALNIVRGSWVWKTFLWLLLLELIKHLISTVPPTTISVNLKLGSLQLEDFSSVFVLQLAALFWTSMTQTAFYKEGSSITFMNDYGQYHCQTCGKCTVFFRNWGLRCLTFQRRKIKLNKQSHGLKPSQVLPPQKMALNNHIYLR